MDLLPLDAGGVHRHEDQRLVLVNLPLAGVGEQAAPVGLHAVGDPHFRAVYDVIVAIDFRPRLDCRDIRAATGFGYADATHQLTGDRWGEPFAFELIRPEAVECRCAHVRLNADGHRHAATGCRPKFFGHNHGIGEVEAETAANRIIFDAEQTELAEFAEHLVSGKLLGLFPFVDMRVDLRLDKSGDGLAQLPMLFRQLHAFLLARNCRIVSSIDVYVNCIEQRKIDCTKLHHVLYAGNRLTEIQPGALPQ